MDGWMDVPLSSIVIIKSKSERIVKLQIEKIIFARVGFE